ncbi:unnamed protein product, partial [Iphiclides podalirius]
MLDIFTRRANLSTLAAATAKGAPIAAGRGGAGDLSHDSGPRRPAHRDSVAYIASQTALIATAIVQISRGCAHYSGTVPTHCFRLFRLPVLPDACAPRSLSQSMDGGVLKKLSYG